MYVRASRQAVSTYGEVNSTLRRHVYALRAAFPEARYLHLVRDGRDVVRSMMARVTMTPQDLHTARIRPHSHDPWYEAWQGMDRFARLCWYWQAENRYVRNAVGNTVRFENLLSDFDYFAERLLSPCHVKISRDQWEAAVDKPRNRTNQHRISNHGSWQPAMNETFWSICGSEMSANGYSMD